MTTWTEKAPKLDKIPNIEKKVIACATPEVPKNGEQSVVQLKDGRLLFLWSEFIRTDLMPEDERPPDSALRRDPASDDGYARISGMTSADSGKTWSAPFVVIDDKDALVNCMSPGLTRMADGRILLAYSWRSGGNRQSNYGNCAKMVRFSSDEGMTWSDRIQITPDNQEYHTGCHDRSYTLNDGRLMVQCHTIFPPGKAQPGEGCCRTCMATYFAYSDDQGESWNRTSELIDPVAGYGGRFEEASMVKRSDGSLVQFIRNWHGQSFISESLDRGTTWSLPTPSGVISSLSPSYLTCIPDSSDLLMLWNPRWNPNEPIFGVRSVLACSISKDGGKTWGLPKALETKSDQWSEYPGVTFVGEEALVHYRVYPLDRNRCDLVQATVPVAWFYDD